jgi:hypothetical protein
MERLKGTITDKLDNFEERLTGITERSVELGRKLEREDIARKLEAELESLKQYGRTELWGLHKALHIVKGEPEDE